MRSWPRPSRRSASGRALVEPPSMRFNNGSWKHFDARTCSRTILRSWPVNANAGNIRTMSRVPTIPCPFAEGDLVLLDVCGAKKIIPDAVYYDITWMGFVGSAPSGRMRERYRDCARRPRRWGEDRHRTQSAAGRGIAGWEVDRATRKPHQAKRYGDYFIHRTGLPLARRPFQWR